VSEADPLVPSVQNVVLKKEFVQSFLIILILGKNRVEDW
jgi:hypothetical protein